jgi:fluoride exporter
MGRELSLSHRILAVFVGGFLGTIVRYLLSLLIQSRLGKGWPYDILLINLTGAFFLALFTTLADAAMFIGPTRRLFLNVGFLGAYTTFSSLALGDILLSSNDQWLPAFLYLFFSMTGGILAIILGIWSGQWSIKKVKRAFAQKTAARIVVATLQGLHTGDHVDIDDDVIYPEEENRI